jgi:hypothetical protein
MLHYSPPQGALIPPKRIRAFVFPSVLKLSDGSVLDIIRAIAHLKDCQVRYFFTEDASQSH